MTREEAIAIIRKEYLCMDRDCDIERSCGKCDLMMPIKEPILEAYKMAIQALEQEPNGDCISRQAACYLYCRITCNKDYCTEPCGDIKLFWALPSVSQPNTGHWIRQTDDYHDYYECEYCGIAVGLDDIKNFCPNCGCRMVDEQEREE